MRTATFGRSFVGMRLWAVLGVLVGCGGAAFEVGGGLEGGAADAASAIDGRLPEGGMGYALDAGGAEADPPDASAAHDAGAPDTGSESCTPLTEAVACADAGCGPVDDGCGSTIDCGCADPSALCSTGYPTLGCDPTPTGYIADGGVCSPMPGQCWTGCLYLGLSMVCPIGSDPGPVYACATQAPPVDAGACIHWSVSSAPWIYCCDRPI